VQVRITRKILLRILRDVNTEKVINRLRNPDTGIQQSPTRFEKARDFGFLYVNTGTGTHSKDPFNRFRDDSAFCFKFRCTVKHFERWDKDEKPSAEFREREATLRSKKRPEQFDRVQAVVMHGKELLNGNLIALGAIVVHGGEEVRIRQPLFEWDLPFTKGIEEKSIEVGTAFLVMQDQRVEDAEGAAGSHRPFLWQP
jgi:hypothetical protein